MGWIQKATASIKKRGTKGVCTGAKFGSSSCPAGSKRYNLAKTFKAMAKHRKKANGGCMNCGGKVYANGGQIPPAKIKASMKNVTTKLRK